MIIRFITAEDNNENANEQIGVMITRGRFACQNGNYKLTCKCENTHNFHLLTRYSRAIQLIKNLSKF